MRCAIYARAANKQDCESQLAELRSYVARRGWETAGEYVDAGPAQSRPQLTRLMCGARREMDCVLVWRLDRWGRNLANCLASIDESHRRGIAWIAVSQGIDMSGPESGAMLKLIGALLGLPLETKRERVKAAMRIATRRGDDVGRPRLVFDHELVDKLRQEGKSIREIAKELGVGVGTVHRLLSVPKGW